MRRLPYQSAEMNFRPAVQLDGSEGLSAIVAGDRALPAAVAKVGRFTTRVAMHGMQSQ